MATNPYTSANESNFGADQGPHLVPGPEGGSQRPSSNLPVSPAAVLVGVTFIATIFYLAPRMHRNSLLPAAAAEVRAQASGNELQFGGLHTAMAPAGEAMDLNGQVTNSGSRTIWGVMAQLTFLDVDGKVLSTVTAPLTGMTNERGKLVKDELSFDPLQRNETRSFRARVNSVPAGWNGHPPEIKALTVVDSAGR